MNVVPYLYLHSETSSRCRETNALRRHSLLLTCCRLRTGVHVKYANVFRRHLVLPEKNETFTERDLGRRLKLENHKLKASVGLHQDHVTRRRNRRGRKDGSQEGKWAGSKEGESFRLGFTVLSTFPKRKMYIQEAKEKRSG